MNSRTVYLFQRDERGVPSFSEHRVWDAEKFIRARMNDAAKLNEKHGTTRAVAVQITAEAYKSKTAPL